MPDGLTFPTDQRLALLSRILRSTHFANADSLRRIVDYLRERTLDDPDCSVKEYDIAIHAVRRPPSFDPKLDPIVRVSVSSIRERLKAYFDNEGAAEPLLVEIPKGRYRLQFRPSPSPVPPRHSAEAGSALADFWAPHACPGTPSVLLYAEVLFFRDSEGNFVRNLYVNDPARPQDLAQRFPPAEQMSLSPSFHFLSAGEVYALLNVERTLNRLGASLDLRNVRFTNWKDLHGASCIVLGSSRTNAFVKTLLGGMPFTMDEEAIHGPGPDGEATSWSGRRFQEGLLERVEEYVLITRRPGAAEGSVVTMITANHGRAIEAGGAMLAREDGCRQLLDRLGPLSPADTFQVLIRVSLLDFDEEVVSTTYVTHRRPAIPSC